MMFYSHWLIYWGATIISLVVCLHNAKYSHLGNSSTIYVDCKTGNDVMDCGTNRSIPCKTLQYVVSRVQLFGMDHVFIDIASGVCSENGVLKLDASNTITHWFFVGSNLTQRLPTIVNFSVESLNAVIKFSYLKWENSSDQISFNVHMASVEFQHCILSNIIFKFNGLNTNLVLQNTTVTFCRSRTEDIPLFLVQTLYNYKSNMLIANSVFSYNTDPIIYAMQLHKISIQETLFLKNGKDVNSNSSLVTVSSSSMILKNSIFNQTLGRAIYVDNMKHFYATRVIFLFNYGSNGSCLLVKRHSIVNFTETVFKQNTNPVLLVKDHDVNILLKACTFTCIFHKEEMNAPFLNAPEGTKIKATNSSIAKPCSVHCKNGEMVKSNLFCEKCPTGSFSHDKSNIVTSGSCQSCSPGTYTSKTGSTNCSLCAEDTYAQKHGNKGCKKCTNDFLTSDSGASSCSKMTIEFILILSGTIPMILLPLLLLLRRQFQKRRSKLKARSEHEKYNRFGQINSSTTVVK